MAENLPKVNEDKNDIVQKARELGDPSGGFSLRPRNFDEAYRFANLIASSDLVPKEFRDKPANVLVAVQIGMELGVSPMQALQNIAVINGKPAIYGDLLPALIYNSGLLESLEEEGDENLARCTAKRKGFPPCVRTFSMEEARKIPYTQWENNQKKTMTLADKDTYKAYPKRMLQMRARAYALRDQFADVLKGLAVREEVDDFNQAHDVTPAAEQPLKLKPQPIQEAENAGGIGNSEGSTDGPVGSEVASGQSSNAAAESSVGEPGGDASDADSGQAGAGVVDDPAKWTFEERKAWAHMAPLEELSNSDNPALKDMKILTQKERAEICRYVTDRRQTLVTEAKKAEQTK